MVRRPRSRAHAHEVEVDVLEDDTATVTNQRHVGLDLNTVLDSNPFAVLQDYNTNGGRGTPDFVDSLTAKLKELHIYSPEKNRGNVDRTQPLAASRLTRSLTVPEIFSVLDPVREAAEDCNKQAAATTYAQGPFPAEPTRVTNQDEGLPSLAETHALTAAASRQTPDSFEASFPSQVIRVANLEHHPLGVNSRIQSSIARHQAGQYDYVLSVHGPDGLPPRDNSPRHEGESTLNFGCNVLVQNGTSGHSFCCEGKPANVYTILATPLGVEEVLQGVSQVPAEVNMAIAEPAVRLISPTTVGDKTLNKSGQSGIKVTIVEQAEEKVQFDVVELPKERVVSISTSEDSSQVPRTPSRSTSASSQSRIEDSVEALDRLEEQLEAVDAAISPSKSRRIQSTTDASSTTNSTAIRRSGSVMKRDQSTSVANKPTASLARSAQRKSVTVEKGDSESPSKTSARRPPASRPTSLLPPKPPVRSSKPPTKPSFELPGDAVARRIKEQREARLAQQAQGKTAAAPVPQRTRSTKAPTRPNFELPGEAISRRKREEREARLKAQEEEERRRREFKARPIKANLGSASYPRETATSRARQNKNPEPSGADRITESPSKRTSILGAPRTPLTRSASTKSPQARGRGTSQASASTQVSRATSTSTSSMSGKRSTLSAEDLEQQRMKSREVFERDNCYLEDKERERRERELNAKLAREQAAERSRQASREWAEKQRRKQLAARQAA